MALVWAWSFDVPGLADCEIATSGGWKPMYDAGWSWYSNYSTLTEAAIESLPRHPATGFGGSDRNLRLQGGLRYGSQQKYTYIDSPTVTWSEVTDGIIQFHYYAAATSELGVYPPFEVFDASGATVFKVLCSGANDVEIQYNHNGVLTTCLTTTGGHFTQDLWITVHIRLRAPSTTTTGIAEIAVNGRAAESSAALPVQTSQHQKWCSMRLRSGGTTWPGVDRYYGQFTVWDDPGDDAMTTPKWIATIRPDADSVKVGWEDQAAGTTNLYQTVDEVDFSEADFCTTTTSAAEIRFGVDTADVDASWAPANIAGVVASAAMRGDGSLYSGRSVVSAPRSLTGTISVTNAGTAVVGVGTAFTTEAQPGDWVKVDAHGADMWTEVASVTDATNIVLSTGYLGATTAGAAGSAQCAGALTATTALTKYVDPTVSVSVPGTGAAYTRSTIDALTIGCAVRKN